MFSTMNTFIPYTAIIEELYEHPLLSKLDESKILTHVLNFIRLVGFTKLYVNKVEKIKIENYRAVLPCDCVQVLQVKKGEHILDYTTDTFFSSVNDKQSLDYKIQGNIIYTGFKEGEIEISYYAIKTDEEGLPMIIDNPVFIEAVIAYIKYKVFNIQFDLGLCQHAVFTEAKNSYYLSVAKLQGEMHRLSLDEAENIGRIWNTALIKNDRKTHFKSLKSPYRNKY